MPNINPFKRAVAILPDFDNVALIRQWLHGRPPTTIAAYSSDIERLLLFLEHKPLNQVTLADLQAFADSLGTLEPSSQARTLKACRSLLSFGAKVAPAAFPINVGAALQVPKSRLKLAERILSEEEVLRILTLEPDRRNYAIIRLLYGSAIRRSELVGLRWCDLQDRPELHTGQITVYGKGSKTRTILLKPLTWKELETWRTVRAPSDEEAPVFDLTADAIYKIVRKAARRAGIEKGVSPHWMRHAHISHALDHGAPIHLVQATSGHANLAILSVYAHARPDDGSAQYLSI